MGNPSENSIDYFREREQHEIALAESATSPAIKEIHLEMAKRYSEMVEQLSAIPPLQTDLPCPQLVEIGH